MVKILFINTGINRSKHGFHRKAAYTRPFPTKPVSQPKHKEKKTSAQTNLRICNSISYLFFRRMLEAMLSVSYIADI